MVDETSGREGVKCLKNFIRLLNTGKLMTDNQPKSKIDKMSLVSPFEEFVTKRLEQEGLLVEPQVGVSGYFIDMGIKDRETGAYILGIECDGRSYHSSKYIRDRDKIRQKQLEALGWTIHRIWSTDWFKTPDKEIEKILAKLKSIQNR